MSNSYHTIFSLPILILSLTISITLNAQKTENDALPLTQILEKLEQSQDLIFNYNPDQLTAYSYKGSIDNLSISEALTRLFSDTPLDFQITDDVILIYTSSITNHHICGSVRSTKDDALLIGANLYLTSASHGTNTDINGQYTLDIIGYPHQAITISYVGYDSKVLGLKEWDKNECLHITLDESEVMSEELVIRAHHLLPGIYEGDNGSIQINYEDLSQFAANQEYDVLHTAQLLPGINSSDESASNLTIRGSTPDQNLVLWEGAAVYDPGHMFGMISSINPFIVDNIGIHKGVYHPRYDNRIGGILDVSLSDHITSYVKGGVGTTMTEAHAYLDLPIIDDKLGLVIAGRNTLNGLISSPTLVSYSEKIFQNNSLDTPIAMDEEEEEFSNLFDYYDINLKAKYHFNENVFLKASFFDSHNNFTASSELFEGELEYQDATISDNNAFSTSADIKWNDNVKSNVYITSSNYTNSNSSSTTDEDEEGPSDASIVSNSIEDFQLGISNEWMMPNHYSQFEVGYIYEVKEVEYSFDEFDVRGTNISEEDSFRGEFHNFYSSYTYSPRRFQIQIGSRMTYYDERESWYFAPRVNAQYDITDALNIKASMGKFYQFVNQVQDFGEYALIANNGIWRLHNANDKNVLESTKITAGLSYNDNGWLIDLEGYLGTSKGLLGTDMNSATDLLIETDLNAEVQGIDFLIKKSWHNYHLWVNYSISQNEYYENDFKEFRFPANNDRLHNLSVVNNWNIGHWSLAATFHYKSGLPYSVPDGIDQSEVDGETFSALVYSTFNTDRLEDYSRWDINASYRFDVNPRIKGEISFSLLNVFNKKNIYSRTYQIGNIGESNSLESFSIDKNLLGFTPKMLFRIHF